MYLWPPTKISFFGYIFKFWLPWISNVLIDSKNHRNLRIWCPGEWYWHTIAAAATAAAAAFRGSRVLPASWKQPFPDARLKIIFVWTLFEYCEPCTWFSTKCLDDSGHTLLQKWTVVAFILVCWWGQVLQRIFHFDIALSNILQDVPVLSNVADVHNIVDLESTLFCVQDLLIILLGFPRHAFLKDRSPEFSLSHVTFDSGSSLIKTIIGIRVFPQIHTREIPYPQNFEIYLKNYLSRRHAVYHESGQRVLTYFFWELNEKNFLRSLSERLLAQKWKWFRIPSFLHLSTRFICFCLKLLAFLQSLPNSNITELSRLPRDLGHLADSNVFQKIQPPLVIRSRFQWNCWCFSLRSTYSSFYNSACFWSMKCSCSKIMTTMHDFCQILTNCPNKQLFAFATVSVNFHKFFSVSCEVFVLHGFHRVARTRATTANWWLIQDSLPSINTLWSVVVKSPNFFLVEQISFCHSEVSILCLRFCFFTFETSPSESESLLWKNVRTHVQPNKLVSFSSITHIFFQGHVYRRARVRDNFFFKV